VVEINVDIDSTPQVKNGKVVLSSDSIKTTHSVRKPEGFKVIDDLLQGLIDVIIKGIVNLFLKDDAISEACSSVINTVDVDINLPDWANRIRITAVGIGVNGELQIGISDKQQN